MNLGRELSTFYRVSSRDGRLQSGSRDEAEMDVCSRGRVAESYRELVSSRGRLRLVGDLV